MKDMKDLNKLKSVREPLFYPVVLALALVLAFSGQALAKKPDFKKKLKKGYHHLQIGNTDKAVKIFGKYAKKYPESGACHTAYGRALKRAGKYGQAQKEFIRATQVEPKYAPGFYYLGVSLEQDRKWKQAAEAFQTFVDLEPNSGKRKVVQDRVRYCKNQI